MDECARMLMNAASVSTIVVTMHVATMLLVLITVVVSKDSKEMAFHVKMLMNANWPVETTAVCMHIAITQWAHIPASVSQDSKGMGSRVKMSMSARLIFIIAVFMHSAITLLDLMTVAVSQVLKEMDGLATTSMNARTELTNVTHTQHVQTLKAPTNAPASLGIAVMVKCVEMSTNVWMDHMSVIRLRLARTLWAPIHVRAMTVSMAMVVFALIPMSAMMEVIFVTLAPAV